VFLEILALETFPVPEVTLKDHSRLSAIIPFDRLHLISYFFHATIIIVNNGVYTIVVPYVSNVAYNRPTLREKYAYFNVFYNGYKHTEQLWYTLAFHSYVRILYRFRDIAIDREFFKPSL